MIRGLYTAGTGMLTQNKKMDVITNNIANLETAGFKQDKLLSRSFEDMLITRINDPGIVLQEREVGPLNTGTHIDQVITDFTIGPLEETNLSTDLALVGDGFFVVNTPDGEMYTRNSAFQLDENMRIVNSDGYALQGDNGDITLTSDDFVVDSMGNVINEGNIISTIRVVNFENLDAIRKTGNNLYDSMGEAAIDSNATIRQGFREASNVDLIEQIVDMIEVSKTFESNQKVIQTLDDTLGKAVNDIGRI